MEEFLKIVGVITLVCFVLAILMSTVIGLSLVIEGQPTMCTDAGYVLAPAITKP